MPVQGYGFAIVTDQTGGLHVSLAQTATGKTKRFYLACNGETEERVERIASHMESLSETLCEQFFNERKPKAKQ